MLLIKSENYKNIEIIRSNFCVSANKVSTINLNTENIAQIFNYDIIYIMGGQIQNLAYLIQTDSVSRSLKDFLNSGTIIGESAGAVILGKDIKWYFDIKKGTKPKYDIILDNYEGLNITEYNIYPHYNNANENIKEKIKECKTKITKLKDGKYIKVKFRR